MEDVDDENTECHNGSCDLDADMLTAALGSGRSWCSSHDMVVACLSLLLVLRLAMGGSGTEGHAGAGSSAAAGDARLLSRALCILQLLIETDEGKRLFLLYEGVATLSMLLRSRNRVIRRPAADIVLALSAEGEHLAPLFTQCANPEWMRSCAMAICDPGCAADAGPMPSGRLERARAARQSARFSVGGVLEEQQAVRESLSILLQRMSAKPEYRHLFR
eukprot:SAG11_NODE_855_length_6868_cov_3.086128_2_plen_219_part_00